MSEVVKIVDLPVPEVAIPITPLAMIDRAIASGASIETLERLMALQERWQAAQAKRSFDTAISEAKSEINPIIKNRKVDFTTDKGRTNYTYEDLAQIDVQISPILSRHGLSYRFRSAQGQAKEITVTCIISHRDGHSEETSISAFADATGNKNSIQAVGSTITYLQRYSLKTALGLSAAPDTDGRTPSTAPTITVAQYEELAALVEKAKADEKAMLQYLGATETEALTVVQFQRAKSMLEKKIARAAKEGA